MNESVIEKHAEAKRLKYNNGSPYTGFAVISRLPSWAINAINFVQTVFYAIYFLMLFAVEVLNDQRKTLNK